MSVEPLVFRIFMETLLMRVWMMVLNATLNNIAVISLLSILLVVKTEYLSP